MAEVVRARDAEFISTGELVTTMISVSDVGPLIQSRRVDPERVVLHGTVLGCGRHHFEPTLTAQ